MKQYRRLPSYHALVILGFLLEEGEVYGQYIMEMTDMNSGTLYPLFRRLLKVEMVEKRLEEGNPDELERPLRIYYRLTQKGERFARRYNTRELAKNPPLVPLESFR